MYHATEWRKELELSEFEVLVVFASAFLILKSWGAWYVAIATVSNFRPAPLQISVLLTTPLICLALLFVCLLAFAAPAVRRDPSYIGLYLVIGGASLGGIAQLTPFLGISARDDALERANAGACLAVAGALLGSCCAFAGANVGDGPGIEAVLFSSVLSLGLFLGIWFAFERLTHISEAITVERDADAGIRLAGFLTGLGLLCGWSVAGDWISAVATINDFARSIWPAISLGVMAAGAERLRWRAQAVDAIYVSRSASIAAAVLYLSLAVVWILVRGIHS